MPGRGRQRRRVRTRLFFGVEGDGEQAFCRWLQELCNDAGRYLHLDTRNLCGGDPLRMAQEACALRERGLERGEYKFSILLIDGDRLQEGQPRTEQTRQLVEREGFRLIVQQPNQEGVLLRLHEGHEQVFPTASRVKEALRLVWREYEKPIEFRELRRRFTLECLATAARHDPALSELLDILELG
jgi:hypothetical protein